jgi:hypothetical protein
MADNDWVREWAAWKILAPLRLISGRMWVGHDKGSQLEGNVQVFADTREGPFCLGDLYLHKHTAAYAANDYFPLLDLAEVAPLKLMPGDELRVVRDVHNITQNAFWTINAWDCEIRLNVEVDD